MRLTKAEKELLRRIVTDWYPYWMENNDEDAEEQRQREQPIYASIKRKMNLN